MLQKHASNYFIKLILLLAFFSFAFSANDESQAWEAFSSNDLNKAIDLFEKDIATNPTNSRAYLALSYIHQFQQHDEKAWTFFNKALQYKNDPNPYIFSAFVTTRGLLLNSNGKKEGLVELFPNIIESPDASGVLKASALSWFGRFEEEYGSLSKADDYYVKLNAIEDWSLIGPFENISASGLDKVFEPENAFEPNARYVGKNSIPSQWFNTYKVRRDKWIDYTRYFAEDEAVFYGNTFVYSPKTQVVQIRVGVSGAVKLFLNDAEILYRSDENNTDLDTYILETTLQEGWNRLLIKNSYSEITACNFLVRITQTNGDAISGIKYETSIKKYPRNQDINVKEITNFAEDFFENAIEQNPQHIENYLLLSDCYLRNDKAYEAERTLRAGLKIMPKSIILRLNLLEAYLRGEKFDELETLKEEMYSLYSDSPTILEWKYEKYMSDENFDKAEEIALRYQKLLPDSYTAKHLIMRIELKRGNNDVAFDMIKKMYKKFPNNWQAVYLNALVSVETSRSYKKSIKMYKKYLKKNRDTEAYNQLGDAYWRTSKIDKFEDAFKKMIELDESATGFYYTLAKSFLQVQEFEKAKYYINESLKLCPSCSGYYSLLGEINQRSGDKLMAIDSYKKALNYNPRNYDARTRLRELEGNESIFNNFYSFDIDSLRGINLTQEDFPDDDAVYVLSDTKRVLYKNGASELEEELLIKILNQSGIDNLKEFYVGYYSNSERLIVEKAVTIKPDESEVNGDISGNQIVFKTLETGDFIYVKYRKQSYNSGRLSHHLWEEIYFEHNYPLENIRYAILVDPDMTINYKTQFMDLEPKITETNVGKLYLWSLENQSSVNWEYDMPRLVDMGKMLFISTIPNWEYLVEWYMDLAKTKTKGSYEIQEVVESLLPDMDETREMDKIIAINTWITDNIRYSSVSFRQSGLIPQKARDVLVTKIGDCKDVATLFIAMGNEAGLKSHYVLVNTYDEGLNKNILPSIAFNHAIVGVETESGKTIFLDLTAQNYPVGSIPMNDKDAFALEIKPGIKAPFYLKGELFTPNNLSRKATVTIDEENVAHVEKHTIRAATLAGSLMTTYRYLSEKDRNKKLTEVLSNSYPDVKLTSFTLGEIDLKTGDLAYEYSFDAPYFLTEAGDLKLLKLPFSDKLESNSSLSYDERKYDFVFKNMADVEEETLTIHLPKGYKPQDIKKKVTYTSIYGDYIMTMKYSGSILTVYRKYEFKKSVVTTNDYKEFKAFYNQVVRNDEKQVVLKK